MRYVLVFICCYFNSLMAQTSLRTINRYTTQHGLSNNQIYCIRQDSRGFLWIGSMEGLNRFDGFQFKRIFAAKDPASGLPGNGVFSIIEYQHGNLLLGTSNGLAVYNTLTNDFENEKIKLPEICSGSGTLISSIFKDRQGRIWVNHSGELDILDSNLQYIERFTKHTWTKNLKGVIVAKDNWAMDKENRLWLAADTGSINIIDFNRKQIWNKHNNPEQHEFLKPSYLRSILLDENAQTLWYAPWGHGVYKYNLATKVQQQQTFGGNTVEEHQSVNRIIKANDKEVVCTNGYGCFVVNANSLSYKKIAFEVPGYQEKTLETIPLSMYKSTTGDYWIGTRAGLFQLENTAIDVARVDFARNGKKFPWEECNGILPSQEKNIYLTNLTNYFIEVNPLLNDFNAWSIPGKKNAVIICLAQNEKGQLWVGSTNGLYQFDITTKKFTQPDWLHPDLRSLRINYMYVDRKKNIWIAKRQPFGLYHYDLKTGKCEKLNNAVTAYFEKVGESSRISKITEDDDHIWMTSMLGGGIIGLDKYTGEWGVFPKKNHGNLLTKGLGFVYADNKGNLWINDLSANGLVKYDAKKDAVSMFTRNDGLPSDIIKCISGNGKDLWLLTEQGVSRFDLEKEKIVFNDFSLASAERPVDLISFDATSNLLFAVSDNLLIARSVAKFQERQVRSLVPLVDNVSINSRDLQTDVNGRSLKLKPGQRNISIDFTAIQFTHADKMRFAYQLAGADNDWKYADVNRSAQYAVLTPGKYIFKIKVADENGNWSEPHESFSFTIVPPFWKTTVFRIAVIILLVAGTWFVVTRRIRSIRHEAELKKQMAETEMMALRAQMNPHFIFNCLNSIDNLIQNNEKDKATAYLARFAKLLRAILENSKQQQIPVWKDMETLKLYLELERMRFDNQFNYQLDIAEELQQGDYKIPPLLIQPYVENAIHHGLMNKTTSDRNLSIRAVARNGEIRFTIEDNGVGRRKSAQLRQLNKSQHHSLGQQLSESRIKLFNNGMNESIQITDLIDKENESAGTRVEIILENN